MSESTHEEEHTGLIKTPNQVFWVSMLAFALPIFVIIGLVTYFTSGTDASPASRWPTGSTAMSSSRSTTRSASPE